jgi:hypothetical protein
MHYNTYRVVIRGDAVVLAAHYFWRHVAWCPARILGVVWAPSPRDTEVSYSNIASVIHNQILRLNIAM